MHFIISIIVAYCLFLIVLKYVENLFDKIVYPLERLEENLQEINRQLIDVTNKLETISSMAKGLDKSVYSLYLIAEQFSNDEVYKAREERHKKRLEMEKIATANKLLRNS